MYEIINTLEDKTIFNGNANELIYFTRKLALENDDTELSIILLDEAIEYIKVYCSNLVLKTL